MPIQPTQADLDDYARRQALADAGKPVYWGSDANAYSYERHVREEQEKQRLREIEFKRQQDEKRALAQRQQQQRQPQLRQPGQPAPMGVTERASRDREAALIKRLSLPAPARPGTTPQEEADYQARQETTRKGDPIVWSTDYIDYPRHVQDEQNAQTKREIVFAQQQRAKREGLRQQPPPRQMPPPSSGQFSVPPAPRPAPQMEFGGGSEWSPEVIEARKEWQTPEKKKRLLDVINNASPKVAALMRDIYGIDEATSDAAELTHTMPDGTVMPGATHGEAPKPQVRQVGTRFPQQLPPAPRPGGMEYDVTLDARSGQPVEDQTPDASFFGDAEDGTIETWSANRQAKWLDKMTEGFGELKPVQQGAVRGYLEGKNWAGESVQLKSEKLKSLLDRSLSEHYGQNRQGRAQQPQVRQVGTRFPQQLPTNRYSDRTLIPNDRYGAPQTRQEIEREVDERLANTPVPPKTPDEKAYDNWLDMRTKLMGRNVDQLTRKADPKTGLTSPLTPEEQKRVTEDRQKKGPVDELSNLNGRLAGLRGANDRARAKEEADNAEHIKAMQMMFQMQEARAAQARRFSNAPGSPMYKTPIYAGTPISSRRVKGTDDGWGNQQTAAGMRRKTVRDREAARKENVNRARTAARTGEKFKQKLTGNDEIDRYVSGAVASIQDTTTRKQDEMRQRLMGADVAAEGKLGYIKGIQANEAAKTALRNKLVGERKANKLADSRQKTQNQFLLDLEKIKQGGQQDSKLERRLNFLNVELARHEPGTPDHTRISSEIDAIRDKYLAGHVPPKEPTPELNIEGQRKENAKQSAVNDAKSKTTAADSARSLAAAVASGAMTEEEALEQAKDHGSQTVAWLHRILRERSRSFWDRFADNMSAGGGLGSPGS